MMHWTLSLYWCRLIYKLIYSYTKHALNMNYIWCHIFGLNDCHNENHNVTSSMLGDMEKLQEETQKWFKNEVLHPKLYANNGCMYNPFPVICKVNIKFQNLKHLKQCLSYNMENSITPFANKHLRTIVVILNIAWIWFSKGCLPDH